VLNVSFNYTRMTSATETRIPCSLKTRELLKAQKRGGECYDKLLKRMVQQYDPAKDTESMG